MDDLNQIDRSILERIDQGGLVTQTTIRYDLGLHPNDTWRSLQKLERLGYIEYVPTGESEYRLKQQKAA